MTLTKIFPQSFHSDLLDQVPLLSLCFILAGIFLLYHLLKSIYLVCFHPLSGVPGPFWAKISYRWQQYHAARLQKAHAIQGKTDTLDRQDRVRLRG